ncbi:MAG: glycerol-3-phosphate 1-O-acyltransferase PlsY [Clostridia bacterium]|nr:glycerol-3-phosphate 1-O-acyltransferase PlsY [Clostridia bacterium]MBQ8290855.1 glycerol-3-phosphate 1-O-acyltransferase PlsY [Clostridia bacterium]
MFNLNEGILALITPSSLEVWQSVLISILTVLGAMLVGYLLGSVNSAIIISRVLFRDDIRRHGSGNAGLTNMLRTYGKAAAGLTLLGDFLKTALSILIMGIVGGFGYIGGISIGLGPNNPFPLVYIAGLFSVIGHIFPVYYKFKGGKGVLCTAVMALILTPVEFLILLLLFVGVVFASKYVSLGSVSAAVLYPVAVHAHFTVAFGGGSTPGIVSFIAVTLAILIVYCHRENLKRISNGTERKLSIGKRPETHKDDGADDSDNGEGDNT